jgi:hypothetical protein
VCVPLCVWASLLNDCTILAHARACVCVHSVVVQDCLQLICTLLQDNVSNQVFE